MHSTLKNFVRYLDNQGIDYDISQNNDNVIRLQNRLAEHSSVLLTFILATENNSSDNLQILIMGLGKANGGASVRLMHTINELNEKYRWFKFHINETGEIVMSIDFYICENSNEQILNLLFSGLSIADNCYPDIMRVLWGGK